MPGEAGVAIGPYDGPASVSGHARVNRQQHTGSHPGLDRIDNLRVLALVITAYQDDATTRVARCINGGACFERHCTPKQFDPATGGVRREQHQAARVVASQPAARLGAEHARGTRLLGAKDTDAASRRTVHHDSRLRRQADPALFGTQADATASSSCASGTGHARCRGGAAGCRQRGHAAERHIAGRRTDADGPAGPAGCAIGTDLGTSRQLHVLDRAQHDPATLQRGGPGLDQAAVAQRSGEHANRTTLQVAEVDGLVVSVLDVEAQAVQTPPGDFYRLPRTQNHTAVGRAHQSVLTDTDVRREQDHVTVAGANHAVDLDRPAQCVALEAHFAGSPIGVADIQCRRRKAGGIDHRSPAYGDAGLVDQHNAAIGAEQPEYLGWRVGHDPVQYGARRVDLLKPGLFGGLDGKALPVDGGARRVGNGELIAQALESSLTLNHLRPLGVGIHRATGTGDKSRVQCQRQYTQRHAQAPGHHPATGPACARSNRAASPTTRNSSALHRYPPNSKSLGSHGHWTHGPHTPESPSEYSAMALPIGNNPDMYACCNNGNRKAHSPYVN